MECRNRVPGGEGCLRSRRDKKDALLRAGYEGPAASERVTKAPFALSRDRPEGPRSREFSAFRSGLAMSMWSKHRPPAPCGRASPTVGRRTRDPRGSIAPSRRRLSCFSSQPLSPWPHAGLRRPLPSSRRWSEGSRPRSRHRRRRKSMRLCTSRTRSTSLSISMRPIPPASSARLALAERTASASRRGHSVGNQLLQDPA